MLKRASMVLRGEAGAVLIVALMTVTVLAVFSLAAVMTASQGLHISADYKVYQQTVYLSDGGSDFATGIVKRAMANGMKLSSIDTGNANLTIASTANLEDEISGVTANGSDSVTANPNATVRVMGDVVSIDVDYLKSKVMPGSSTESAARYEGIGSGTAGGVGIYYKIDAYNRNVIANSSSTVRINFKCVEGGGRCL